VCVWDGEADVACLIKMTAGYWAHSLTLWAVCWNGWECIMDMSHNWASGLCRTSSLSFLHDLWAHTHTHTQSTAVVNPPKAWEPCCNIIAFLHVFNEYLQWPISRMLVLHVWRANLEFQMFSVMESGSLHVKPWPLPKMRSGNADSVFQTFWDANPKSKPEQG